MNTPPKQLSCPFFRNAHHHLSQHHPPVFTPSTPYHHLAKKPSAEIYAAMGSEGIHAMIHQFYEGLHNSEIAPMFSRSSHERSVERSSAFFIQLLGGPTDEYRRRYGAPRMRARHLPFVITEERRKIWLQTFFETLHHPRGFTFPPEHLDDFKTYLDTFSRWMLNCTS